MLIYKVAGKTIIVEIPATNNTKFRFKKRKSNLEFGKIFSTRKLKFDKSVYLEWQIGYDVPVNDVAQGIKSTRLKEKTFIGSNKKQKFLYELSELLAEAINIKLISVQQVVDMLAEAKTFSDFLDNKAIEIDEPTKIIVNGTEFNETKIKLPTFYMMNTPDGTQVEVSIEKQQYASGVQPMLYFCIPIFSFENNQSLIGRPSDPSDNLNYVINENNASVLLEIIRIFAMCSQRHNRDVVKILEILTT